jgi:hypothetical protein
MQKNEYIRRHTKDGGARVEKALLVELSHALVLIVVSQQKSV